MILTRTILIAFVLLALVACGRRDRERQQQQPTVQPTARQDRTADALFDEFFDAVPRTEPQPITMPEPVRFTEPAPTPTPTPTPAPSTPAPRDVRITPNGRFVVQVSTIASTRLANDIVKRLERQGFPAYSVKVENPTPALIGTYYRIRIGGFDNISDARYFGETRLRPLGYDFWVDNRSNDAVGIGGAGLGTFQPQQPQAVAVAATPTQVEAQRAQVEAQPKAVEHQWDWDAVPATPAPTPTPAPAAIQVEPISDNSWDNFEW